MGTSYLRAHPFGNRYPEWMSNLHSDRGQDSNQCARGSQGLPTHNRFHCTTVAPNMYLSLIYLYILYKKQEMKLLNQNPPWPEPTNQLSFCPVNYCPMS